ncbi:MAG: ABC transporter ATP-binding protein, partial [Candidatus Lokiarchaeota archaeon]|nr:ABC transporter ATP-binding protein [Candidatus Lokiarchaeota archaeon]
MIFETLGMYGVIFRILNNNVLYFAIMVTIFFFLHKPFLGKFGFLRISDEKKSQNYKFNKIIIYLIGISWFLAGIFLSMRLLQIELKDPNFPEYPDNFSLGVLWSFATVFICIIVTSLINRSLSDEKRIEKKILRSSMYGGAIITFGLWFIQLLIFEVYINKWLGFQIIIQDIRVLFIVVVGLYITIFFNLLRSKLLPEVSEKSSERVQELLMSELKKQSNNHNTNERELILKDQDSSPISMSKEKITRYPQGISLKIYVYLLKKFNKSESLDDEALSDSIFNKSFNKILVGLIWGYSILLISIVKILLPSNTLIGVFFLSCMCALFMVVGDLSLIFLFNRNNPVDKRVSKILLQQTALFGGILTFFIWFVPFFVIYLYLFILIADILILNLTFIAIFSITMFLLGTKILFWYATSIKMWDAATKKAPFVKKKASRINLAWFIVNIPLRLFLFILSSSVEFYYSNILSLPGGIYYSNLLSNFWANDVWPTEYDILIPILFNELIIVVINIIIGTIIALKVYKKKFGESLKFIILSQIVIYLVSILVILILGLFQSLVISYHFNLQDPRIPLLVGTGIYIITVFATLKEKLIPETSGKIEDKFSATTKTYAEEDQFQGPIEYRKESILNVQDLTTYFYTEEGVVRAVEGVSFKIYEGETLGLVGETGCGKSVTALSILRLVRPPGEIKSGRIYFKEEDLHQKTEEEFLKYRGNKITMIFQDPLNSLNPVYKIGDQISEVYRLHMEDELLIEAVKKNTSIFDIARKWSRKILKDLNIPTPRIIFDRYPHELSGGMRQRVQIAMGLACSPKLLIADEPTTALDVTIQNQILQLMKNLKKKYNTSILFITHDLGIISKMCDRVAVMYSGFIVEYGDIEKLFITPYHPYTRGLISSVPVIGKKRELLDVIPGMVPNLIYP